MVDLKIIYQDNSLIVFDKPAGLVVTESDTDFTHQGNTLEAKLKSDYGITIDRGGIVHRLDKDTSGVIVVAKTQPALENLQSQFKNRQVKKEYLALVHGLVKESGKIEGHIGRNPGNFEKLVVFEGGEEGRSAVTLYEPIKQLMIQDETLKQLFPDFNQVQFKKLYLLHYPLFTLLLCRPQTGRTHQIRVHLKHIGFPILGDRKYAGRKILQLDAKWCPRQFLHAAKLEFMHPETGNLMKFESELPEDLKGVLNQLIDYGIS